MDCACIYVDGGDGPEFYTERDITARKEHTCYECGRIINKGERYERVSGKWYGRMDTFKTCIDCQSVRRELFCDGWAYGGIWEDVCQHISYCSGEIGSSKLANLTPRAREKVCELIEEEWDELDD